MVLSKRERDVLLEAMALYSDTVNERARRMAEGKEDPENVGEIADELNLCVGLVVKIQLEPTPELVDGSR